MYLSRLRSPNGDFLQAAVRVPSSLALDRAGVSALFRSHMQVLLSDPFALGMESATYRISLAESGEVSCLVVLTAGVEREDMLRRLAARLLLLEGVLIDSVAGCQSREDFDRVLGDWGNTALRRDDRQVFTNVGRPVLAAALIFDHLDQILARHAALGWAMRYQVNACRWSPDAAALQSAAGNLSRLRLETSMQGFAEAQHRALVRAGRADVHVEEFLEVPDEGRRVVETAIAGSGLSVCVADEESRAAIVCCLHSYLLYGALDPADDALAGARASEDWNRIAGWRPNLREFRGPVGAYSGPSPDRPPEPGLRVDPSALDAKHLLAGEGEPFVFVSYAHADAPAVALILDQLKQGGVGLWFDIGIPGASEWDDVLERRLSAARGVIAFLSGRSVGSKYCRREVKFADAICKPILPVLLEPVELTGGMALLLGSTQMLQSNDAEQIVRVAGSWAA